MNRRYTNEQIKFVRDNINGRSWGDMTELFNEKFKTSLKMSQLTSLRNMYGIRNNMQGKHKPWNKGIKGVYKAPNRHFTKFYAGGGIHWKSLPVGSETEKKGYVRIKIAEPNVWKYKHIFIWEQLHGKLPKGHIVIFADKNNRNFDTNNLLAVSRAQLVVMNKHGLIFDNGDATKAGKTIAQIKMKIRDKKLGRGEYLITGKVKG